VRTPATDRKIAFPGDWTKEQFEEIKVGITKTIPLGRWAHSEEIAKAAFFWLLRKAAMWQASNCSLTAVPFRSEVGTYATISGLYCQVDLTLLRWLGPQLRQIHANQHSRAVHLKQQYDWIVCGRGLSDRQHARLSSLQSFRKTRKAFM
jgi:hypothetical protein